MYIYEFHKNPFFDSQDRVQPSPFGQKFDILMSPVTENMGKVTKIQQLNSPIPVTYPYEFNQNPPIGSLNRTQITGYTSANADANRSAPKAICPLPLFWGTYKAKAMTLTSLTVVKKGNLDYFFRSKLNSITNKKSLIQTTCAV